MSDLLKQLANTLHAEYRQTPASHQGYHATCPKCGKPAKRGQKHFFFSERGFKCWTCGDGWHGSLKTLANFIGLDTGDYVAPDYHQEPIKVESSVFPYDLINRYEKHPKRIQLWQSYKPLSEELIIKYRLGVGRLPKEDGTFYSDERLIVPLIRDGKLVMLRGRSLQGSKHPAKWLTRGTPARLMNGDLITSGSIVLILENWIDALLAMQIESPLEKFIPVAPSSGAGSWQDGWSKLIAKVSPRAVIIGLDNDEAGKQGAIKIANSLLAANYRTEIKGGIKFHQFKTASEKESMIDAIGSDLCPTNTKV